jgi:hypothetical protein
MAKSFQLMVPVSSYGSWGVFIFTDSIVLPTGYQQYPDPENSWICPVRTCRVLFTRLEGVGAHFNVCSNSPIPCHCLINIQTNLTPFSVVTGPRSSMIMAMVHCQSSAIGVIVQGVANFQALWFPGNHLTFENPPC